MKVIMFHYVTDNFNYYHYDLKKFDSLIKELSSKYRVISVHDINNCLQNGSNNDLLLTFDDGTKDNYEKVYPILKKYNCSGLFFVTSSIYNKKVLTVQLIHQIISKNNINNLFDDLMLQLKNINFNIKDVNLIDTQDNIKMKFFKQCLQYILSDDDKNKILNYFCSKYNISTNVNDYYISRKQMQEMKQNGMEFGLHTVSHPRLSKLSEIEQENEIEKNINDLLSDKLIDLNNLCIAYPFGDFNENTLKLMKKYNVRYGFKADDMNMNGNYEIGRIDCNKIEVENE